MWADRDCQELISISKTAPAVPSARLDFSVFMIEITKINSLTEIKNFATQTVTHQSPGRTLSWEWRNSCRLCSRHRRTVCRVWAELAVREYREYGGSTGQALLVAMLGDGEAAIRAAGLSPEKVIVVGRSIGSLYAIELADRHPAIAGLIIESGAADPSERFLTYADLEAAGIAEDDVLTEVKYHFDHEMKLADYENPLLILHTENDGLIDISHAEQTICPIPPWQSQYNLSNEPNGLHGSRFGFRAGDSIRELNRLLDHEKE